MEGSLRRKILVTSALPYANGSIHLGHMVEYIQTDIWARFQRIIGNECYYICADDAHGTPIMLKAKEMGLAPDMLVSKMREEHLADFHNFAIAFDYYGSTHSLANHALTIEIYRRAKEKGHIVMRNISQAFDPIEKMFLPDRFVKGSCPHCLAKDQYGDNCEVCGATYSPADLLDAVSALSGVAPVTAESDHYFFKLNDFKDFLRSWVASGSLQEEVRKKLMEWFEEGLQDWDISRDAPYFGFKIPDTEDKYFYVWLDAPIGYMASFMEFCQNKELQFLEYWGPESSAELYHFIGKDIIYFHSLFWPATLCAADYRIPTAVFAHGFLTVDGKKMSKSRGTFIKARSYLDHLDPEYLRYYFAAKLGAGIDDIDLNFNDFRSRVNADLVGKVVNIASRCAGFIHKYFSGKLSGRCSEPKLYQGFVDLRAELMKLYEQRNYNHAIRKIISLADEANQYIDNKQPWKLIKENDNEQEVHDVCTMGLNLYRVIIAYLAPVLPITAEKSRIFLNCDSLHWAEIDKPLLNQPINLFTALMQRVDDKAIAAVILASQDHR